MAHPLKPQFYQTYKFSVTYGYDCTCKGCNIQQRHTLPTQFVSRVFALLAHQQKRVLMICSSQTYEWCITTSITQNSVQKWQHRRQGISYINYRLQQIDQQKLNFINSTSYSLIQTADVNEMKKQYCPRCVAVCRTRALSRRIYCRNAVRYYGTGRGIACGPTRNVRPSLCRCNGDGLCSL